MDEVCELLGCELIEGRHLARIGVHDLRPQIVGVEIGSDGGEVASDVSADAVDRVAGRAALRVEDGEATQIRFAQARSGHDAGQADRGTRRTQDGEADDADDGDPRQTEREGSPPRMALRIAIEEGNEHEDDSRNGEEGGDHQRLERTGEVPQQLEEREEVPLRPRDVAGRVRVSGLVERRADGDGENQEEDEDPERDDGIGVERLEERLAGALLGCVLALVRRAPLTPPRRAR